MIYCITLLVILNIKGDIFINISIYTLNINYYRGTYKYVIMGIFLSMTKGNMLFTHVCGNRKNCYHTS